MKLQGRNLEPNMRGEDVALLQTELRQLGFDINDTEGFFGPGTLRAVKGLQKRQGIEPASGIVDKDMARLINIAVDELEVETRVVLGNVLREDGSPVTYALVRAFDQGIREKSSLGETRTDGDGHYEIHYPSGKDAVCLIVRAIGQDGEELAASDVIFGPEPVEAIDLVVGERLRGPSEFSRLEAKLLPALAEEDIRPADVTADEAEFIARKYGLDLQHLGHYVLAARLHEDTELPSAIYYGLFRQNLPTRLPALLAQDPVVLRRALESALDENLIPANLRDILDTVLDRMQGLIVRHAFRFPEVEGTFSLNDLFNTTRLTRGQQEKLLTRYVGREGSVEKFWKGLEEDPEFGEERVREAQFALQLGTLTANHLPLIEELKRQGITSTRQLVKFTEVGWLQLIKRGRSGGGVVGAPPDLPGEVEEEKQANYAKVLEAIVEDAFPTAFLAARLAENEEPIIEGKDDLLTFLDRNPDFEFERTKVDSYLRQHGDSAFEGVEDQERLTQNLKAVRRLTVVAPRHQRYGVVKPLLQAGLTSAQSIARKESTAVALLKETVGEAQAQAVVNRASHRSAMAQTLFAEFSPSMHRALPQVIFPGIQPAGASSNGMGNWLELLPTDDPDLPNWETLFGNIDFCACEHCRSVLSPAAYLVDILAFVVDQGLREAFLLPSRRGDIGNIELNCANTNTPLPYIDLVNEILENAVAGSGEAHQTTWTAEELRAQPEHRNDDAYTALAGGVYPWSLPFSLPHEESWRYLGHLGVQRYRLMDVLRQEGDGPSDVEIAADHLHLTPLESAIITGEAPELEHALPDFWGMPGDTLNELRTEVRHVPTFLKQAGLQYRELLERLSLPFINPTGNQRVAFQDIAVCDLDTADFFHPLSESFLDRFHRFERLRRKLGAGLGTI